MGCEFATHIPFLLYLYSMKFENLIYDIILEKFASQRTIDAILDRINKNGIDSLSPYEKSLLDKISSQEDYEYTSIIQEGVNWLNDNFGDVRIISRTYPTRNEHDDDLNITSLYKNGEEVMFFDGDETLTIQTPILNAICKAHNYNPQKQKEAVDWSIREFEKTGRPVDSLKYPNWGDVTFTATFQDITGMFKIWLEGLLDINIGEFFGVHPINKEEFDEHKDKVIKIIRTGETGIEFKGDPDDLEPTV